MVAPLMPKATALWLIRNTSLTFAQISEFCALHILEIQNLADLPPSTTSIVPFDPVASGQLSLAEIHRCEKDPDEKLCLNPVIAAGKKTNAKQHKYIPLALRSNRPNAIWWVVKHHPQIPEKDICKLLGTTKSMVMQIKNKTYWNMQNLKPQNPASIGLCTELEFDELLIKYPPEKAQENQ